MEARWRQQDDAGPGASAPSSIRHGLNKAGRLLSYVIMCSVLLGVSRAFSRSEDDAEYKVKLAFLYNFAQFVEWPPDAFADADAPLTVCVAGEDPFNAELEQSLRGRKAGGHPVEIRRFKPDDDPRACHIIFVRASEKKAAGRILASLNGSNTLSVGEAKGFAERGGIINMTLEENKLRFEVNVDAAAQTRLKISSKLLALAKIVKEPRGP
jgi:YfiR/HmsC-like